jgi:hypothetical protein
MRDKHQTNKTTPRRTLFSGDSIVDMKQAREWHKWMPIQAGWREEASVCVAVRSNLSIDLHKSPSIKEQIYEDVYELLSDLVEAHTHIYDALQ